MSISSPQSSECHGWYCCSSRTGVLPCFSDFFPLPVFFHEFQTWGLPPKPLITFFFHSPEVFFFLHVLLYEFIEWVPAAQAPLHWFSQNVLLWGEQSGTSVEAKHFSLGFLLFLIVFLHTFQEAISALRGLNMLSVYVTSVGKNLALNLFVSSNANSMLGNTRLSQFRPGNICGELLFEHDAYNITFVVNSHGCGWRNYSMFSKRLRELIEGASLLSLCVGHFGKLLEVGSFSQRREK